MEGLLHQGGSRSLGRLPPFLPSPNLSHHLGEVMGLGQKNASPTPLESWPPKSRSFLAKEGHVWGLNALLRSPRIRAQRAQAPQAARRSRPLTSAPKAMATRTTLRPCCREPRAESRKHLQQRACGQIMLSVCLVLHIRGAFSFLRFSGSFHLTH